MTEPDRRFEDIVERLTGYRQTEENEETGDITGHPARVMQVRARDAGALPNSFEAEVPDDAYVVVEADPVGTIPAG